MNRKPGKPGLILAIDQGTTGTRAILYDSRARQTASAYQEFSQRYPKPGWVEHDPLEIWNSMLRVIAKTLFRARLDSSRIAAIGITNQRETTVLWDRKPSRPVYPAIVWQDRRTASFCDGLKSRGLEKIFRRKTGLVLDPYFSGTKIRWILDHVPNIRRKAERGEILFGTIDTWLLWKLTGGKSHATDFTNASRTLLFNIRTKTWDSKLLRLLKVPSKILPETRASSSFFGKTVRQGVLREGIPIHAMIGDQQAALYGQACYHPGEVKNTYGTGCFVVMNAGRKWRNPAFGLLATLACDKEGRPVYALEGSVFIAGAAIQWLRDGLGLFKKAAETDKMIKKLSDNGGVTLIPAFARLGSPYWNPNVRGVIYGITRGTTRAHHVRAALESMARQKADVVEVLESSSGKQLRFLKVDGGATQNKVLMQFQADLLGVPILVSEISESTAWGAAKLAAKSAGVWTSLESGDARRRYRRFNPKMKPSQARPLRAVWKKEISRLLAS